jgi:hypothetical protein
MRFRHKDYVVHILKDNKVVDSSPVFKTLIEARRFKKANIKNCENVKFCIDYYKG